MNHTPSQLISIAVSQGKFPSQLYKYRALDEVNFEKTASILKNAEFWFSQAKTFNDPFDCNLSETKNHDKKDIKKYFNKMSLPSSYQKNLLMVEDANPGRIRQIAIDARKEAINNRGILSLSKTYDQILMWAHYSSSHNGLVIGLDLLECPEFF